MSTFLLDGHPVPFTDGQSIREAALAAGTYIPHLCHHEGYQPHGSCRVCTVKLNGRVVSSCTARANDADEVESETDELRALRVRVVQMLLTEGNHFCPSCEQSGSCTLQAVAYDLGVTTPYFPPMSPVRPIDASHPDILLDLNRCILCELCVRASAEVDHKRVFALGGRGPTKHLVVDAESGRLGDTTFDKDDAAAHVCPVGVILHKRRGFAVPIGARRYDQTSIREQALAAARKDTP